MRWILKLTGYALLVAVFAFTLITVPPTIESDLLSRSQQALKGKDWVLISIDGRDITLSGHPPDQQAANEVLQLLNEVEGIRNLHTDWSLATGRPEPFTTDTIDFASVDRSHQPDQENESVPEINLPIQINTDYERINDAVSD